MTRKLKTLKDISKEINREGIRDMIREENWNSTRDIQLVDRLRQEAIKRIKSNIKDIEEHSHKKFNWNNPYMECIQCRNRYIRIRWIKHFFNITKKDLK